MDVQKMRLAIYSAYKGDTWRRKVDKMPDDQVIAIYYRLLKANKF